MTFRPHPWFAAVYDRALRHEGATMHSLRRAAAGQARGRVLELGCGTGLNLEYYDWGHIERLDAVEPDPYMLGRARQRVEALPDEVQQRVRLHEVMAEVLPFDDASFDSAVSTLVLCTVEDISKSLSEAWRVLKPGAALHAVEHVRGHGITGVTQKILQPAWGWCAAGCHLDRDTEEALRKAGFVPDVRRRARLGPFLPALYIVAAKPG